MLKALEKDPSRRYRSCTEFAADLQRWLAGDAVLAREPSRRERAVELCQAASARGRCRIDHVRYAARRICGDTVGSEIARDQATQARHERDRAQSSIHFLTDTLSAASPEKLGRNVTVLEVLQHARAQASARSRRSSGCRRDGPRALSDTFLAVGDMQAALDSAEHAVAAARTLHDDSLLIDSETSLGYVLRQNGELQRAQTMLDAARADAVAHGSPAQRSMAAQMLAALALTRQDNAVSQHWYRIALEEVPRTM